jgi:peptide/nickel transport system substrate-binding protein
MLRKNWSIIVIVLFIVVIALGITVSAAPKRDTLTVVITSDISTLDPNDNIGFSHHQVTRQIYETLVVRDENMKLVPWLAESWEYENDVTIVFKIRKGVHFHNGDELKASDVLFSLKRIHEDNCTGALFVNHIVFDKCEVIDDYTVKIVTDQPYAMQIAMLEHPLCSIISERVFTESGGDFFKAPVGAGGTGPYKFVSYNSGDKVVLEAFDDYWIKGQPYIKNVVFRIIADSSSRAIEAEAGGADIIYDIGANDIERVRANKNINLVSRMGMNTSYITFNTAKAPLDNILVREAIWYGVDVASAIKVAYGEYGGLADNFLSPGVEGRHPDLSKFFVKRDVEKAKALLVEAGYPDGLTLHISVENSNQQRMDVCEAMQAQLAEVGITLMLDFMEENTWSEMLIHGNGEMSIYGQTASTGEAGRVLLNWLPNTSEYKIFGWVNQEFFDILNEALATIDVDKRNKLFYRCQEMLMENFVALPIWYKEINAALKPEVKGFNLMPTYQQSYLQYVNFE